MCSARAFAGMPCPAEREFAIIGRSNVGKSSFINHVFGDRTLARISKSPGKTVTANFYRLTGGTVWVDLPGYGFSRRSREENERIERLIRDYCQRRENLAGIIWLLDIRHPGMDADTAARRWLAGLDRPVLPVLTKGDKMSSAAALRNVARFQSLYHLDRPAIIFSCRGPAGRESFWNAYRAWTAPARDQ